MLQLPHHHNISIERRKRDFLQTAKALLWQSQCYAYLVWSVHFRAVCGRFLLVNLQLTWLVSREAVRQTGRPCKMTRANVSEVISCSGKEPNKPAAKLQKWLQNKATVCHCSYLEIHVSSHHWSELCTDALLQRLNLQ